MKNETFERAVKAIAGMHKDMVNPYVVVEVVLKAIREPSLEMQHEMCASLPKSQETAWKAGVDYLLRDKSTAKAAVI